jgi:hypothetical protein
MSYITMNGWIDGWTDGWMHIDIIAFGGLTVFTGLVGTAGGGIMLDRMRHGLPDGNASMAIAFKLMTILSIIVTYSFDQLSWPGHVNFAVVIRMYVF